MPRKAKFPPKVQQHRTAREKASGKLGRARLKWCGQDVTLGPWGSPEADAAYRRFVAEISANGGQLPPAPSLAEPTVAEVVAAFLAHAQQEYDPQGREVRQFEFTVRPLLALYGPTPARAFDSTALEAVQRAMADGSWMDQAERERYEKRRWPAALCRNVVNRRVTRIRTLWRWAERKKLVLPGSFEHLRTVAGLKKNARGVRHTADRAAADLGTARLVAGHCPPEVGAMLELQALVGMRSCEVRVLRPCDLDRSGEVWLYRPTRDKSGWRDGQAPRTVPLGPECQRVLAWWLARCPSPESPAFRSQVTGGPYTDTGYAQAVRRAAAKAGVKLQPYSTRHGAKMRITKEHGADAARAVLGQKSISTTAHYGSIDVQHASEVARKIG